MCNVILVFASFNYTGGRFVNVTDFMHLDTIWIAVLFKGVRIICVLCEGNASSFQDNFFILSSHV
jgi:hypothetical protein